MKLRLLPALLLACLMSTAQTPVSIIPQPVSLQVQAGHFTIGAGTGILFTDKTELQPAASFLAAAIQSISGYALPLNSGGDKPVRLVLQKLETGNPEAYELIVTPTSILIRANTKEGIFYGIQSLLQTLPAIRTNAALQVPCMTVTDHPRFAWRGMHLDVSRHFFGPEVIRQYIDMMAAYKMNIFHWHLVDDPGWRIEIKKYPNLTQTGAWRVDKNHISWRERPQATRDETPTYGGYYTQQQLREIVAYARERNITIVPEIEMPGHEAAVFASYPQYSCTQLPQLPITGGNYTHIASNFCAGNDSVFTFLQDILTEVMDIFPSTYIHIGGDEVDKGPWKKCARCQARIKAEGLKDENELQSYFIRRIEKFIVSKNRKMIGWDEILEGGLAPEATVMSWRGEAGGIEAARMKHQVVMTPGTPCYFDHYQAGPAGEPLAIGGFNTLKKVYDYEPIPKELTAEEATYVMGAQGNVWTEFIMTAEHLEYMVLPRMLALSEVLWSPAKNKDWKGFNERLQSHFRAFGQKGLHYCPGNFTVNIQPSAKNGKLTVELSSEILNGDIYYTLDGTSPGLQSKKYEAPIELRSSAELQASTVINGQVMGMQPSKQNFVLHKAIGSNVSYANPVSTYYPANGNNSLVDGIKGTMDIHRYWHGFSAKDLVATVDLGEIKTIQQLSLGCLQKYRDWIFLPRSVKFEVSADGITFTTIETVNNPVDMNTKEVIHEFTARFPAQPVKFIRITAKNSLCPPGHNGAGKPAWIFADEIVVE